MRLRAPGRGAGVAFALTAAVISGFAVFTNSYGVRAFGNATVYTTAKNLVAAIVLGALLLAVPRRAGKGEGFTRPRNLAQWTGLGAVAVIGWHQWSWAIATGLILAAYVATWFAALARAGAIDVTALLVPAAIITALLQADVQGKAVAPQWPGLLLVAAGAAAIGLAALRKPGSVLAEVH